MGTTRREFIRTAAYGGAVLGAGAALPWAQAKQADSPGRSEKLDLLILGGTGFLGPHVVEAALARGHTMTLFNRGRTNPHLFPDLEKLVGDRDPTVGSGLTALEGHTWDGVIDTSGYVPRIVSASATLLAEAVRQYVFISSVGAYADWGTIEHADESMPLDTLDDPETEQVTGETYGPLKAACQLAAEKAMPGRVTSILPGLIVGPLDRTDRFTYWPVRVARGGEIVAPGNPQDPVQYIDARDLGAWMIHCIEQNVTGMFNAVGPDSKMTMAELLYGCKAVTGGSASFTWVDADFLAEREIQGWRGMPVWADPAGDLRSVGTFQNAKALKHGFTSRPLAETVRDLLDWFDERPAEERARQAPEAVRPTRENFQDSTIPKRTSGIGAKREAAVLAEWREAQG